MRAKRPIRAVVIATAFLSLNCWTTPAPGDGGTLRAWKQQGDFDVAVFTEPSPVVAGLVDLSVLVLDRKTGEPNTKARVMIELSPVGRPAQAMRQAATRQAATNKLLRAAVFELPHAGRYEVDVGIEGPTGIARIQFVMDVGKPWSPLTGIWPWILWPVPVILLYVIHRRLVDRSARRVRKGSSLPQNKSCVDQADRPARSFPATPRPRP